MKALRVAMVVYGDIRHDSRVQREAASLAGAGHRVTLYCLADTRSGPGSLHPNVTVVAVDAGPGAVVPGSVSPFRHAGRAGRVSRLAHRVTWLASYVRTLRAWGGSVVAQAGQVDVWHAHDFTGLAAIGGRVGSRAALVYDVHDLFIDTGSGRLLPGPARRAVARYERHLVSRASLVVTVNRALAEVFVARCRPRAIIVVHNCPAAWQPPDPRPDLIRRAAGIPAGRPIVLYHGLLGSSRGIDRLLEAIQLPGLEDVHLALLGYGELAASLAVTATEPRFEGRVHVLDAVAPEELLPWVASADVGAMAMPNDSLNLYLSTPNKLFECLAAGTPVVVSDFPAVRTIVEDEEFGPLGVTCHPERPEDVARAILELLGNDPGSMADLRRRCSAAAQARWNWEAEMSGLIAAYERLAPPASPLAATSER
jgi:glycosyltransferase involved in cell wall biosynthesis